MNFNKKRLILNNKDRLYNFYYIINYLNLSKILAKKLSMQDNR